MHFLIRVFTICLGVTMFASGAFAQSDESKYITKVRPVSGVAAVVNGEMISLQDLQRQVLPEIIRARINKEDPQADAKIAAIQQTALDNMIIDIMINQEATKFGLQSSDKDVEAEIQTILDKNEIDIAGLERSLISQGLNLEFLKERIRKNQTNSKLMQAMVTQQVLVPQAEIENYYNDNRNELVKNKTVTLEILVFSPKAQADIPGIVDRIESGTLTFGKAAQAYSVGPSAQNGGKIGAMDWGNVPPLWRQALSGVPVGSITPVFQMEEGQTATIKLIAEEAGEAMTLMEAEPIIDRILKEPLMQERYKKYTQKLRDKAVIVIRM